MLKDVFKFIFTYIVCLASSPVTSLFFAFQFVTIDKEEPLSF